MLGRQHASRLGFTPECAGVPAALIQTGTVPKTPTCFPTRHDVKAPFPRQTIRTIQMLQTRLRPDNGSVDDFSTR